MSSRGPSLAKPILGKLFHFDSPTEVYTADACVVTCFDARFDLVLNKFLKRRGITTFDHIKIPGSAKAFGAPDCEADRAFALRMLRTSIRLHRPARLILIGHNDCGAYPGEPPAVVAGDLLRAVEFLCVAEPSLPIETYFADFDGIYDVR